jgi:RNA polymerase sigma factor for flagellar operon FliA
MRQPRRASSGLDVLVRPDRAEASLWRRFRATGQGKLRDSLFDRYSRFAASLARRHGRRVNADRDVRDDLEQCAYRGLLEAIDRYDPLKGVPFMAFASSRIAGSIVDGMGRLSEWGAQFRFRRRLERERMASLVARDDDAKASSAIEQLAELVTELAFGLMLAAEERAAPNAISGGPDNGFDSLAWRETQVVLHRRVTELPEPERSVVRQHYQQDLPFAEIADMLGLSRGRISQLHKSALGKLRKSMRSVR